MLRVASLAVTMCILWLLLSGYFTKTLLLGLGAASVILTLVISVRMGIVDREGHPIHLAVRSLLYWPWLIKEIVLANVDIAKAILGQGDAIRPSVFRIKASQKSDLGKAIYANSITLTPGTVTIALDDDGMTIHALTASSAEGLATGDMDRKVTELEGAR